MVKLIIISDTHGLHMQLKKFGNLPDGDVLIHAGDISNIGELGDIERFLNWFTNQPHEEKIFIAGNHDWGFERFPYVVKQIIDEFQKNHSITYLENSSTTVKGINFWGSPITPPFKNWAFMAEQDKRKLIWDTMPNDIDVLITHGPPYNILDYSIFGQEHTGCKYLREKVFEIKPILHTYGHIHEEYGVETHDDITFINASNLNEKYQMVNKPIFVNIDLEKRNCFIQ